MDVHARHTPGQGSLPQARERSCESVSLGASSQKDIWDSGAILGHSSVGERYPEDLYGWSMGLENMLNN